jgi:hypothetical protein
MSQSIEWTRLCSLRETLIQSKEVSGHDFSRASSTAKSAWALAPAVCFSRTTLEPRPFAAAPLATAGTQNSIANTLPVQEFL